MEHEDANFELNLLPIISLLAVCISFLLLTAIWVNIGTLDIKQAMGESSEKPVETPKLQIKVNAKGFFVLDILNLKSKFKGIVIKKVDSDLSAIADLIERVKTAHPEVTTAMVIPNKNTKYQSLIRVFEHLKSNEIKDIGVSPI